MKDITDTNYNHAKRMWKGFEIKNLGEYHDLYVHSDTLLIADVLVQNQGEHGKQVQKRQK